MAIAAGIGAGLGAFGGALKSGPEFELSAYGREAQGYGQHALTAYRNLVGQGPGAGDIEASLNASRGYANTLNNFSSSGLYDMAKGNQLAAQQFAGQRTAMEQAFQDQLAQANRAASLAGRSSNDPILRARLAQEQTRQQALLQAQQSAAAVDFGRQSTLDTLSLQGQRVSALQGLSNQAFANQQNLFGMAQQAYQTEYNIGMGQAQYEQSRGGGLKGALTGAMAGAGAGLQAAQGLSAMGANDSLATYYAKAAAQPLAAAATAAVAPTPAGAPSIPRAAQNFAPQASALAPMPAYNFSQPTLSQSPFLAYQAPAAQTYGPFQSINPAQRSSVFGANSFAYK